MDSPYVTDDRTHVIPVRKVRCNGCECLPEAVGELRWNFEKGAEFTAHFPGVSHFELHRFFRQLDLGKVATEPEWTAETADGLPVLIHATHSRTISIHQTEMGKAPRDFSRVEVEALYACVDLPKGSPVAYWHNTGPTATRMMCFGFACDAWSISRDIEYDNGEGGVTTIGRGLTELCNSPRIHLSSEADLDTINGVRACWLVTDQPSVGITYPHRIERGFISFLSGKRTRFFWHDAFMDESKLRRTYYGWERVPRGELIWQYSQPLPLFGTIDSLNHAKEVVPKLAGLYSEFVRQATDLRVPWILNPIWAGATELLDDQFTFACVSLERLAQAWKGKAIKKQRPAMFEKGQAKRINKAFRRRINAIAKVMKLNPAQAQLLGSRVNDVCRPPNADVLSRVFTDLGIELSSDDRAMLNDRNKALHGGATLAIDEPGAAGAEHLRCLRLQTLISRAILRILEYEGPYINFASQSGSHVEYL
jgi:hypothetical protein